MKPDRELLLGTAGHIDHGKTALVRALTGIDTDRLPAEKQRGITIDLGFAALDLGPCRLGLVDVPGHERFIRNMLAGATGLDLALLVVAADDSVMPQTREHLLILRLLGIPAGVVALTKCDLAEPDWLEMVESDIRSLAAGTFLEGAEIVRTSTVTGAGIAELRSALARLANAAPGRGDPGLFRLAIDRTFTVAGHGTVVTGTVASGTVAVGDELQWWPEGRPVRVRGLQQHDRPAERLTRGSRAALNLAGVRHTEIERGQELGAPGYLAASRTLSVEVHAATDSPRPLRHRGRYRIHLGTADVSGVLSLLDAAEVPPGGTALGQLSLATPVVAVHGEPFVLRAESPPATLGGGRILQPTARRVRRRDRAAVDRIDRLRASDPLSRLRAVLAAQGLRPATDADLVREAGIPPQEVGALVRSLIERGELVELPIGPRRTIRVPAETVAELEDRALRALGRLHAERPRQSAVRRSHVAASLPDLPGDTLIAALLDRLQARGALVGDARTVAHADHHPSLTQAERRLKADLLSAIRAGGSSPPDLAELTRQAGARGAVVPDLLALLAAEGQVVEIGGGVWLDADTEADLRRRVAARLADGSAMTMAELRDLIGATRKFAVPFGEHLDRVGLTLREGDLRRLGSPDEATAP
jgi:selenocysteine-specific elongation factor